MSPAGAANVYFGTSAFAATVLGHLAASSHRPSLVVTPPDRRRGRGRRTSPPPAAERARELGIEVLQAESVNRPETVERIRAAGPAVATICAFGQLIGEELLGLAPFLNVHPSLLPRWRGAAPIERAIMAGDEETGVAVIRLTAGLDSGPVALLGREPIGPEDTYGDLAPRLADLGGRLLVEALDREAEGRLELTEQEEEGVTYAEKIDPAERRLEPRSQSAAEVSRIQRALHPHIGSYVETAGDRLKLTSVRLAGGDAPAPGTFAVDEGRLILGCADGALEIAELQPPGGRPTAAADYLRGHDLPGAVA